MIDEPAFGLPAILALKCKSNRIVINGIGWQCPCSLKNIELARDLLKIPVTATRVRDILRKTIGTPLELWGRSVY